MSIKKIKKTITRRVVKGRDLRLKPITESLPCSTGGFLGVEKRRP